MVKIWSENDPKAGLMARKRKMLVDAALQAFLESGYGESSVNRIAAAAGVSIKTLYRHFESKDDLFSAVIQAACTDAGNQTQTAGGQPSWYDKPPLEAFAIAGGDYLRHLLSMEQLALYRVVMRDVGRFPEIGRRYHQEVIARRDEIFSGYLERWIPVTGWRVNDKKQAASLFASLLKAGVFEEVLLGGAVPDDVQLHLHAEAAAGRMIIILEAGRL